MVFFFPQISLLPRNSERSPEGPLDPFQAGPCRAHQPAPTHDAPPVKERGGTGCFPRSPLLAQGRVSALHGNWARLQAKNRSGQQRSEEESRGAAGRRALGLGSPRRLSPGRGPEHEPRPLPAQPSTGPTSADRPRTGREGAGGSPPAARAELTAAQRPPWRRRLPSPPPGRAGPGRAHLGDAGAHEAAADDRHMFDDQLLGGRRGGGGGGGGAHEVAGGEGHGEGGRRGAGIAEREAAAGPEPGGASAAAPPPGSGGPRARLPAVGRGRFESLQLLKRSQAATPRSARRQRRRTRRNSLPAPPGGARPRAGRGQRAAMSSPGSAGHHAAFKTFTFLS